MLHSLNIIVFSIQSFAPLNFYYIGWFFILLVHFPFICYNFTMDFYRKHNNFKEKTMNHFKPMPKWMIIQQVILLGILVLYGICLLSGGLFTSYYATILLSVVGIITVITALLGKQWLISLINFAVAAAGFLLFISIA